MRATKHTSEILDFDATSRHNEGHFREILKYQAKYDEEFNAGVEKLQLTVLL